MGQDTICYGEYMNTYFDISLTVVWRERERESCIALLVWT
jgi:hypothetical protein